MRVIGGMFKGYSLPNMSSSGQWTHGPDMYIVHGLIDLTVGFVI